MFRAFSRPSSGAQWLQWQPLVLSSYRGDSLLCSWLGRLVFETETGFVLFQVRITFLNIIQTNLKLPRPCSDWGGLSQDSYRGEPGSIVSPCEICGRQSGTGKSLPLGTPGFPLSVLFHQCSILISFVILLSEGQAGEAWEPSNHCYAGYRTALKKKTITR